MNRMINLKSNLGRTLSQIYLRPDTNIFAYEKNRRAYEMKQIVSDFDQPVAKDMIIDYLKELRETKVRCIKYTGRKSGALGASNKS